MPCVLVALAGGGTAPRQSTRTHISLGGFDLGRSSELPASPPAAVVRQRQSDAHRAHNRGARTPESDPLRVLAPSSHPCLTSVGSSRFVPTEGPSAARSCTNSSATTAPRRSSDAAPTRWRAASETSARRVPRTTFGAATRSTGLDAISSWITACSSTWCSVTRTSATVPDASPDFNKSDRQRAMRSGFNDLAVSCPIVLVMHSTRLL